MEREQEQERERARERAHDDEQGDKMLDYVTQELKLVQNKYLDAREQLRRAEETKVCGGRWRAREGERGHSQSKGGYLLTRASAATCLLLFSS